MQAPAVSPIVLIVASPASFPPTDMDSNQSDIATFETTKC
jgi:hypothetical protein